VQRPTRRSVWPLDPWTLGVFAGAFALVAATGLQVVTRLHVTGDEPWYLLQSYSVIHHYTPDLSAALRDPRLHRQLLGAAPDDHTRDYLRNGERLLYYLPGYAAAIAPFYALGGRPLIALFQALVAALTATLLFWEARRTFGSRPVALFACLAYLATLPVLVYVGQIFPSTLAAGATFLGYVLVTRWLPAASGRSLVLVGAAVGALAFALPWLHIKYALTALVLAGAALLILRPRLGRPAWYAAALVSGLTALGFLLIALYSHHYFGAWTPPNARQQPDLLHPRFGPVLVLYRDMFFGQQDGLIPWVPLDLLVAPGLVLLWRRHPLQGRTLAALLVAQIGAFVSAAVSLVSQGKALPARFTLECAPLFALCAAAVFAAGAPALRAWLAAVAARTRTWMAPEARGLPAQLGQDVVAGKSAVAWAAVAAVSLALLAVTGWFALVGQIDPDRLYPGPSGPRLAEEYPNALPETWFALFPPLPGQWVTHGVVPLAPAQPVGLTLRNAAGAQGVLGLPARMPAAAPLARSSPVFMPPGHYLAAFILGCDPTAAPTTALRLAAGLARRSVATTLCAGIGRPIKVALPFTSDGYHAVVFRVAFGGTTAVVAWSVSYAPISSV
jgi:hypothetical protein